MEKLQIVAESGIVIALSPTQLLVGSSLLSILFAGSLLVSWHKRLFTRLIWYLLFRLRGDSMNEQNICESLFAPVVATSYTTFLLTQHGSLKASSELLDNLDHNNTQLIFALFRKALRPYQHGISAKTFHIGGTSCSFHRQIPPFTKYQISSRVLCWNHKWLFVVTSFSKPGSGISMPRLQASVNIYDQLEAESELDHVYASAITQYVFKKGHVTYTPVSIIEECSLLPQQTVPEQSRGLKIDNIDWKQQSSLYWSLEQVQAENQRHLELIQNLENLRTYSLAL